MCGVWGIGTLALRRKGRGVQKSQTYALQTARYPSLKGYYGNLLEFKMTRKSNTKRTDTGGNPKLHKARLYTNPVTTAARVINYLSGDQLDINALVQTLQTTTKALESGDPARIEQMLAAQVHTLDSLFGAMSILAVEKLYAGRIEEAERVMRLALRAQNQTARTAEALTSIKNPKQIAYVAQANIANGPQQINNGPNKLSGATHELYTIPGASSTTRSTDSNHETMVTIDWPEEPRGKSQIEP